MAVLTHHVLGSPLASNSSRTSTKFVRASSGWKAYQMHLYINAGTRGLRTEVTFGEVGSGQRTIRLWGGSRVLLVANFDFNFGRDVLN